MKLRIKVPATTANIGPGFDSLGIALSLFNEFRLEPADRTSVTGCDEKYAGPGNLFLRAMRYARQLQGLPAPEVRLSIDAGIPLARGLGSSAAMIVGGVAAALLLDDRRGAGVPFDARERQFILDASAAMEGHPDNAAPAVHGGFCASIAGGGAGRGDERDGRDGCDGAAGKGPVPRILCSRSEVDPDWGFHALIPPFELSTREARAALPATLSRADAVFNLGRAALVALAFEKRDALILGAACEDRIHQPYRKALIPGYDAVTEACLGGGAVAVWLSGAGPTILALCAGKEENSRLSRAIAPVLASRTEGPWKHEFLYADPLGVSFDYE